jgi:hypothetical protein
VETQPANAGYTIRPMVRATARDAGKRRLSCSVARWSSGLVPDRARAALSRWQRERPRPVTFENFVAYGIDRGGIAPALREVQALGFAEITQHGRGGNAEYRLPNLFRLTYEPTKKDVAPTNEWKRFAAGADHAADTKMMAEAAKVAELARKNQNLMLVARMKKLAAKNRKPVRKTHTGTGAENQHRKPKFTGAENPHYGVSRETHTTLDTLGRGRPADRPLGRGGVSGTDGAERGSMNRKRRRQGNGATAAPSSDSPKAPPSPDNEETTTP